MRRSILELDVEVAAIGDLSRADLARLWEKTHGHPPPKGVRQELLVRSASWHLQAKRLGGLSAETRRQLRSAIAEVESEILARDKRPLISIHQQRKVREVDIAAADQSNAHGVASPPRSRRRLSPGARLVREWNGRTHVVDVIENGFVFQAKVHKSLTAIAHQITGAHWSGPRFFGL